MKSVVCPYFLNVLIACFGVDASTSPDAECRYFAQDHAMEAILRVGPARIRCGFFSTGCAATVWSVAYRMFMRNIPPLALLRTQQAAELCGSFDLSADARALLASISDVGSLLESLIGQQLWRDAALMLAHGLQKRAAVWWACAICRSQLSEFAETSDVGISPLPARELPAVDAAERWVRDPQEKHRLAARDAAAFAGNRAPAHWAAMAAFWATGNMTPDAGVVTSPPPFLYALEIGRAHV